MCPVPTPSKVTVKIGPLKEKKEFCSIHNKPWLRTFNLGLALSLKCISHILLLVGKVELVFWSWRFPATVYANLHWESRNQIWLIDNGNDDTSSQRLPIKHVVLLKVFQKQACSVLHIPHLPCKHQSCCFVFVMSTTVYVVWKRYPQAWWPLLQDTTKFGSHHRRAVVQPVEFCCLGTLQWFCGFLGPDPATLSIGSLQVGKRQVPRKWLLYGLGCWQSASVGTGESQ